MPLPEALNLDALAPGLMCTLNTSVPTIPTSSDQPRPTTTPTSTDDAITPISTTTNTTSSRPALSVGAWVGVGIGVAMGLVVVAIILLVLCVLYRRGAGVRGFYDTNESNGGEASMLRYSASLRQLSSEVVSLSKEPPPVTEHSWPYKNGGGDYSNGGPPAITKDSMFVPAVSKTSIINTTSGKEKEYYL